MLEALVAEAGLSGTVSFVGSGTQAVVHDGLARADVFVTPSVPTASGKREGIPVVLMEAMSSGVPVVASDLSGIPELVVHGTTGLLTPPRDAGAIADAIQRLHGDRALGRRLAAGAREKVEREFDVRLNAAALIARFAAPGPTR